MSVQGEGGRENPSVRPSTCLLMEGTTATANKGLAFQSLMWEGEI